MSERTVDPEAAKIMIKETETMVDATKKLFEALNRSGKAHFPNLDGASISFAMAVHSIIDYGFDLKKVDGSDDRSMMSMFLEEFCNQYSA